MIRPSLIAVVMIASTVSLAPAQDQKRPIYGRGDLINDVDEAIVAMHATTPFMESSTLMLIDVDLTKIDVDETFRLVHQFTGGPKPDSAAAAIGALLETSKRAGVGHLFVTAATRSITDGGPLVIIPCADTTAVSNLASTVLQNAANSSNLKVHQGNEIVLAGSSTAIDRVTNSKGVTRSDLILPTVREKRFDHMAVIALPAEARRELAAFWPDQVPNEIPIQFSPRDVVEQVSRIIISWKLPPEPEVLIQIECTNASGAESIREIVGSTLDLVPQAKTAVTVTVKAERSLVELQATPEAFAQILSVVAEPSRRRASILSRQNSLKYIGLALHSYHDVEKHFPPSALTDPDGKPLYSWRVAVLPYLEQQAMYNAMKLDQPWDSDENRVYARMVIPTYSAELDDPSLTTFRAPVFPRSLWDGEPKKLSQITDGTSNTIAVIEAPASAAVEWSNPAPWVLSLDDPMSDVFGDREQVLVLLCDGAALLLEKSEMTNEKLKAMLTINGKEVIDR